MTVSTTINSTLGVVSTVDGASTTNPGTVTISGLQSPVVALTTAATLSAAQAGAFTFGNGGSPVVYVMPLASSCPGSVFTFRNANAQPNALTCSQEANGTKAFTDGTSNGSKVALAGAAGNSVSLLSDGQYRLRRWTHSGQNANV